VTVKDSSLHAQMPLKMKNALAASLVVATLVLTLTHCAKENPCEKNVPDWCNLVDLSNEYIPVCGCDDKTYQNAGHATCIGGVTYTEGPCK
jgi:hypothetical protein